MNIINARRPPRRHRHPEQKRIRLGDRMPGRDASADEIVALLPRHRRLGIDPDAGHLSVLHRIGRVHAWLLDRYRAASS